MIEEFRSKILWNGFSMVWSMWNELVLEGIENCLVIELGVVRAPPNDQY